MEDKVMENNRFSKESLRKTYSPMIENWEFVWPKEQDMEVAKNVLTMFVKELYVGNGSHMDASGLGKVAIKGKVYGSERAHDGADITTSFVVSIDRVDWKPKREEWMSGKYGLEEIAAFTEEDIYCATTHSGHKYYFRKLSVSANMFVYLGTICRNL